MATWTPAALFQPPVPYPAQPFQRPMPPPQPAAAPQHYQYTMPWSQLPGTMGFPGDMAEYQRRFQQSYSSPNAALGSGNTAALAMFRDRAKWDNLPGFAKRARTTGVMPSGRPTNAALFGGYGAAGGYGGGDPFQQAHDAANQANEARYQDALYGFYDRYRRGLGMLAGMGQQEARDINEIHDQQFARNQNDLIGRGLGNSTVMATMRMGTDRERAAALGRLNERVRGQVMNTDAGLSADVLNFMERKTETGPDPRLLAQLAQGVGAAGMGMGGGGFGGSGGGSGGTAWVDTGGFPAGAIMDGSMAGFGNPMASMTPNMFRGNVPQGYYDPKPRRNYVEANTPNSRAGFGEYGRASAPRSYWGPTNPPAMQAQVERGLGARNYWLNAPAYASATAPPGFDLYNPLTWSN